MTCGDWFSLITCVITFVGFGFTIYELIKKGRINRAKFIKELIDKIRDDDEIRDFIYFIDDGDYQREWFLDKSFYGRKQFDVPNEKQVDKTLTYFSYLCYLRDKGIINKDEFKFFDYEIHCLLRDKSTINYLYNLYYFAQHYDSNCPFIFLINYGTKKNKIKADFFDETLKNHNKYRKVLL